MISSTIERTSTEAARSSKMSFAMGTLLTPCKDSEGTKVE